jgi:hypothetical protein
VQLAGAQLVPVAKGNGYGVGNVRLAQQALAMGSSTIAVGSVHEAAAVLAAAPGLDVLVLEPFTLRTDVTASAWRALLAHPNMNRVIVTLASPREAADLAVVAASTGSGEPVRCLLEGITSMRRFGMTEDEIAAAVSKLRPALESRSVHLEGLALHLPIATPEQPRIANMAQLRSDGVPPTPLIIGSARVHEVVAWGLLWPSLLATLAGVYDAGSLWVSHLADSEIRDIRVAIPDLPLRLRMGTRLWLGERGALSARGSVLAVHPTRLGQPAGYHQRRTPREGHVVVVSGGTSHGVALTAPRPGLNARQRAASAGSGALEAAGRFRSPFHLPTGGTAWFLEPPHMHVSMLRIPRGLIPPPVGEYLDCDVRFTTVQADVVVG